MKTKQIAAVAAALAIVISIEAADLLFFGKGVSAGQEFSGFGVSNLTGVTDFYALGPTASLGNYHYGFGGDYNVRMQHDEVGILGTWYLFEEDWAYSPVCYFNEGFILVYYNPGQLGFWDFALTRPDWSIGFAG